MRKAFLRIATESPAVVDKEGVAGECPIGGGVSVLRIKELLRRNFSWLLCCVRSCCVGETNDRTNESLLLLPSKELVVLRLALLVRGELGADTMPVVPVG